MSTASDDARVYRLTRPDGLGFFRHRSGRQFGVGLGGVFLALVAVKVHGAPVPLRIGLVLGAFIIVVLAAARTPSGENAIDVLGPAMRYIQLRAARRSRWAAPLSLVGTGMTTAPIPPLFGGLALFDFDPMKELGRVGGRVGIVRDRGDGSVAILLRISGEGFLVAERTEQDERLGSFGQALAQFGREGHPVVRVTWSQWLAPAGIEIHRAWLAGTQRAEPDPSMVAAYDEVLAEAGQSATRSEVIVALSVGLSRVKVLASHSGDRLLAAVDRLLDEADRFAGQLQRGGLVVSRPLSAANIAQVLRERLDPTAMRRIELRARSLGELAGVVSSGNGFPLAIEEARSSIRTDGSVHRVFRVAEWPRTALRADWLAGFLCGSEAVRSFTVSFVPQSRRAAKREASLLATKAASSIDDKQSHRRRVGAEERRAQSAAEALDEELEAGAGMELFFGLVDVCAPDLDSLESACEQTIQLAGNCGMELRPLDLRQGEALVAALPMGRSAVSAR
jgi:hypothetical protein